jgi:hypothetical protein
MVECEMNSSDSGYVIVENYGLSGSDNLGSK